MENTFPISRVPLIFTQYRIQILEETGREWFHTDNNPHATPVEASETSSVESETETPQQPEVALASAETETPASHQHQLQTEPTEIALESYDHPDPWDTPPLILEPEAIAPSIQSIVTPTETTPQNSSETSKVSQKAEPLNPQELEQTITAEQTVQTEPETVETAQTESQTGTKVNLFPFESETIDGNYDLTEFANGEIEVPPVAVRDTKTASFEKLNPLESEIQDVSVPEVETDETRPSNADRTKKKKKKSNASSAEIAKYRLRNIV